jgi:hypothetical protein
MHVKDAGTGNEGRRVVLSGQQVIDAASDYPPMIVGMCYDSAEILAGVYSELRIAEGTRSAELPSAGARLTEHGWCVKQDGSIIDPVFAQELENDPELDPAAIRVTYTEEALQHVAHTRPPGVLRDEIRRRAGEERPPLVSASRRWKFAERQRDMFTSAAHRRWSS